MPSQTSILAELYQPPKPNSSKKSTIVITFITTLLTFGCISFLLISVSVAWIHATKHFLNDKIKTKIFQKNSLTSLDNSIDLLSEIGFYAALYMVSLTFTVMTIRIFNQSVNPAILGPLQPAEKMNELIRSFTQALIMFACLFLYFLENSKKSAKTEPGFFLPFWFLSGYALIAVGYLFEIIIKRDVGVTKLGQFVVVFTFGLLLAQIGGLKIFKLI